MYGDYLLRRQYLIHGPNEKVGELPNEEEESSTGPVFGWKVDNDSREWSRKSIFELSFEDLRRHRRRTSSTIREVFSKNRLRRKTNQNFFSWIPRERCVFPPSRFFPTTPRIRECSIFGLKMSGQFCVEGCASSVQADVRTPMWGVFAGRIPRTRAGVVVSFAYLSAFLPR